MNLLKNIPIHYKGELHDVRLINFSVEIDEVKDRVPPLIKVRDFNGRAMISMVDVKLNKMRPIFMPSFAHFNYRHFAFRLLVDDSQYNNGLNKGIYFLRAFTNNRLVIAGGRVLTDYNLEFARIEEKSGEVMIAHENQHVRYSVDDVKGVNNDELKAMIGAIDRAYSVRSEKVYVTEIQREKWPIQSVRCIRFKNTFFKTARFEGAFRVFETIYYDWLPAKAIHP